MSKIVILDEKTANQIAAGEVIERPASVVKEMVENAIDAGATQVTVEIKNGGISYIRITDNGSGMEGDDVEIAFERHATSKMRRIEDLDALSTMGFRGEALASIAAVSHLEVATKTEEATTGTALKMEGGKVLSVSQVGCPKGTSFVIRNLFYNTPARYKFLKKDVTEAGYVSDILERLALAYPGISFKLISNNQVQLHTPGNHDLRSVIYSIYGKDIAKSVLPVEYESEGLLLSGYVGKPEVARGTRSQQSVFLNGRYIKSRMVSSALEEAYKTLLMQNKFPFCVLLLKASPESFDVNVHPQKLEVRFSNEGHVYSAVFHGVKNTLLGAPLMRSFEPQKEEAPHKEVELNKDELLSRMGPLPENKPSPVDISVHKDPVPEQTRLFEAADTNRERSFEPKTYIPFLPKNEGVVQTESVPVVKASERVVDVPNNFSVSPSAAVSFVKEETAAEPQEPTRNETLTMLSEASIVGQAFDTYILMQSGDTLYIIDQHAAHERIRYETLKKRLMKNESFAQGILELFIIKLSAKEYEFVMEKRDDFMKLGFELEAFGPSTVILRSVPDFYDTSFCISDFHEILDRWMQTSSPLKPISDEALFMMSCKGALKANRALSKEEIRGLVKELCSMENPFTCVHGRPVIIEWGKKELEKRFKRIV